MNEAMSFLVQHGEIVLFVVVFLEQAGLPLPSTFFLIAAGTLVGAGTLSGPHVIVLSFVASLAADLLWFEIGRRGGMRVVGLLCRVSIEPDSCVRLTQEMFTRTGLLFLLFAKFVPGLSTIAPPLAGVFRFGLLRFLVYDALGSLIWVTAGVGIGYLFADQLGQLGVFVAQMGVTLGVGFFLVVAGYILFKFAQRRLLLRRLKVGRITAEELRQKMEAGENVLVMDLRHPLDLAATPFQIPGALRIPSSEVVERHEEVPRDREIVLYCS